MSDFKGKTAMISGGLGDIGRAIARAMLARGARVALGDLVDEAEAQDAIDSLGSPEMIDYRQVDVSDADAVSAWVDLVEERWGAPALVIPNAATVTVSPPAQLTPEKWERELAVNLYGAFYLAQAAGKRMVERKIGGRVVFVGSWAGHAPHPQMIAYCTAKAGVRMLCRCLALEWAPHGILVNEVAPGYVDAGLSGRLFREAEGRREKARARVPVRELIEPDEVAVQVVRLCEKENRHITGTTVVMDGGLSLVFPSGSREEK